MYFFKSLFILLITISLYSEAIIDGKMGILTSGITNASNKEYGILFGILLEKLSANEDVKSKLKYYEDEKLILNEFIEHKLDYVAVNPIYYLKNQDLLDPYVKYYWSLRKYESKFQKMILVVRKDSKINSVKDLKEKKVILEKNNFMGKLVLDKVLLKTINIRYKDYIKKLYLTNTDLSAVLQVFFKKSDVAIIPQSAYDLICEMNPAINKSIKIIYDTKHIFMPILSIVNNQSSKILFPKMKKIFDNVHKSIEGKNFFELIRMKNVDVLSQKELEPLKKYYAEYIILKNKYKR